MEVFVLSPSFPDYLIGSAGTVVRAVDGATRKAGHVLSPVTTKTGHKKVKLSRSGKKFVVSLHRLVIEAHVSPPPFTGAVCRHYDDNPSNNHVLNLFWGTHMDNHNDRRRNGHSFEGERNGRAKLTADIAAKIRSDFDGSYGCKSRLARKYGVGWTCINDVIKNRKWQEKVQGDVGSRV